MIAYSHVFINSTRRMVPLAEAVQIIDTNEVRVSGFKLADAARVKLDRHGDLSRDAGGWSYGHVLNGHICAGAGVLNSLQVCPIN
jgi:hypothetical protein